MAKGFPRAFLARVFSLLRRGKGGLTSAGYEMVAEGAETGDLRGWHACEVVERQESAFAGLLDLMRGGHPRQDFVAAVEAVRLTGENNPSILEVGCAHGFYSDVLSQLLGKPLRYVGLDYSAAAIGLARRRYPGNDFIVGDATALPFADAAFDIVLNGTALMHIPEYPTAIRENARVSRRWSIFHTVPVLQRRATTRLKKRAYGGPVFEVVFNESELLSLLSGNGLGVRHVLPSIEYDLVDVLGEHTVTKTYLCERDTSGTANTEAERFR